MNLTNFIKSVPGLSGLEDHLQSDFDTLRPYLKAQLCQEQNIFEEYDNKDNQKVLEEIKQHIKKLESVISLS